MGASSTAVAYAPLVVGISLLTLVPGAVGGSEVYARELLRALALHGELEYRVLLPTLAPDAAGGLPHEVAPEYRASRGRSPGRLRAMTLAAAATRPARGSRCAARGPSTSR